MQLMKWLVAGVNHPRSFFLLYAAWAGFAGDVLLVL